MNEPIHEPWIERVIREATERVGEISALIRRELPSLIADTDRERALARAAEINKAIVEVNAELPDIGDRLRQIELRQS